MDPRRWEEIQAAFDELVGLDAAGRASRLMALGATDPELRAAVEALVSADVETSAEGCRKAYARLPRHSERITRVLGSAKHSANTGHC